MKSLHHPNLFCWSAFNEDRNIDFNSTLLCLEQGNVAIDPLPLSPHDLRHVEQLGGLDWIVITNSDHVRDSAALAQRFGASVAGPNAEKETLGDLCDVWLKKGDKLCDDLTIIQMDGSKTPGELCLLYGTEILITGDLIRAHQPGALMALPAAKLTDPPAAVESIRRVTAHKDIQAVLVGDGWHLFDHGHKALCDLVSRLERAIG